MYNRIYAIVHLYIFKYPCFCTSKYDYSTLKSKSPYVG